MNSEFSPISQYEVPTAMLTNAQRPSIHKPQRNSRRNVEDNAKRLDVQTTIQKVKRVCEFCGIIDPVGWRKGPHGLNTLCNACGLRWAKSNRRNAYIENAKIKAKEALPSHDQARHPVQTNLWLAPQFPVHGPQVNYQSLQWHTSAEMRHLQQSLPLVPESNSQPCQLAPASQLNLQGPNMNFPLWRFVAQNPLTQAPQPAQPPQNRDVVDKKLKIAYLLTTDEDGNFC